MSFRRLSRFGLILALLVSGLSLSTSPTQAAGQAQLVDPTALVIWCPAAVIPPTPNKNHCTDAYTSLNTLWSALDAAEPAQAGTIWMGKNLINGFVNGNQTFDGAQLPNMANFPLKFNGGWNGLGKSTLSTTTPTTFDGTALTVQNWIGGVTLLNLRVKNSTATVCNVSAAVCVETAGKIKLDRVQVADAVGLDGVYLDNTSSVSSVTVTNSLFLRNEGGGLIVSTNGAVMLKNVISVQNTSLGVDIANSWDATASPVAITNSLFIGNSANGLKILSNGTVTLTGVETQNNGATGMYVGNLSGSGNVLLQGINTFVGNGNNGLDVATKGSVMAKDLIAYDNGGFGVIIDGSFATTAKVVTISGSGMFKGNTYYGLSVHSRGPITASNLTAISNGAGGLYLRTFAPGDVQAVTLTNVKANLNMYPGIEVYADGKVTLSCGTAYGNTDTGLVVRNSAITGPAAGLKLQGFRSYLNGTDEDISSTSPVVRTACPQ
jgi:hypothetical protein